MVYTVYIDVVFLGQYHMDMMVLTILNRVLSTGPQSGVFWPELSSAVYGPCVVSLVPRSSGRSGDIGNVCGGEQPDGRGRLSPEKP